MTAKEVISITYIAKVTFFLGFGTKSQGWGWGSTTRLKDEG